MRPNGTAARSVPSGAEGSLPCAMPVRRPGASHGWVRPGRADHAAAGSADGQPGPPLADSLQRVLDGLRNLG
ncbi:MAG: hypothetical protein ACR2FU_22560 [Streptosporangiaceae bacterium]